jgi:phosphatidylglycerophosphate synthase
MQRAASALARLGASPNAISIAGMVHALLAGAALASTRWCESDWLIRALCLLAAIAIQARLICNLLDGMVAIEGGKRSSVGELYNEIPDRVSDVAVLVGAGYALGALPVLGWGASVAAVWTAYIRAVGKGAGAGSDFGGPMDKKARMMLITLACVIWVAIPSAWRTSIALDAPVLGKSFNLWSIVLSIITLGSLLTCVLRLRRIARTLRTQHPIGPDHA